MEITLLQSSGFLGFLSQPWHWAVSGAAIALILFLMNWMGRSFGVSMAFKSMCTIAGAGKRFEFFNFNVKDEYWRLAFVGGAVVGGFITSQFLASPDPVAISGSTIAHLKDWNMEYYLTTDEGNGLFNTFWFNFKNVWGIFLALLGGFLVGFGARYGDGCTSGHAISGLANLQLPSLLAVIGFFIGGLLMTWGIFPLIFG
ncbi:MAG: YeeE/YedE family protein [Saprospirales bacterium]|nr:YeeE/YedE family protein [Saprospirales bacterium]